MSETISACPFCASTRIDGRDHGNGTPTVWMVCGSCHAEGPPADWRGNAIAAWNTRAAQPPLPGGIAEALVAGDIVWLAATLDEHRKEFGASPIIDRILSALSSSRPVPTQEQREAVALITMTAERMSVRSQATATTTEDAILRRDMGEFASSLFAALALLQRTDGERS